jgi:hypothetical protein
MQGFRSLIRNVDCDHALDITISIVGAGPRTSSAVKSTAYESEMQELPAPSGMSSFRTELMTESIRNAANESRPRELQGRQGARHHDRSKNDHGVHVDLAARRTHH